MELRIDSAADQNILSALRDGDRRWAATLMVRYYGVAVYEECLAQVPDLEAAEDLTQAAFTRAFAALRAFRGECSARDWLVDIARACAKEHAERAGGSSAAPAGAPRREDEGKDKLAISDSLRRRLEILASAV
jgi:DNA-directed RNA polymerase specialized sigma24 family protein